MGNVVSFDLWYVRSLLLLSKSCRNFVSKRPQTAINRVTTKCMLGSDSAQHSSCWRPLLTLADSHYGCQKTRASKEQQPEKGVEAPSKPSNLLPHPTCGPKHNTICPTCCTQNSRPRFVTKVSGHLFCRPQLLLLYSDSCRVRPFSSPGSRVPIATSAPTPAPAPALTWRARRAPGHRAWPPKKTLASATTGRRAKPLAACARRTQKRHGCQYGGEEEIVGKIVATHNCHGDGCSAGRARPRWAPPHRTCCEGNVAWTGAGAGHGERRHLAWRRRQHHSSAPIFFSLAATSILVGLPSV